MSAFSEDLRAAVTARAGHLCEYCRLPIIGQVARFPIDHIIPRTLGGKTEMENLALAFPHCNSRKWCHTEALDPLLGTMVPLFNPRTQPWSEHFQWSQEGVSILFGKTPTGRATIERLKMNHEDLIMVRNLLRELKLFPVNPKKS